MIEYVAPFDVSLMSNEAVVSDESSRVTVRVSVPSVKLSLRIGIDINLDSPAAAVVMVPLSEPLTKSEAETHEIV